MSKRALFLVGLVFFVASSASSEWGEPVNLGPNVNSSWFEYYPSISADGMKLYFAARDRPGGFGSDDIWVSTWDGTEWGVPVNGGPNVNWEWRDLSPSISSDGAKLYFVSWGRPGGYGLYDIWVSTWEDTMWGPSVNVGPNVNTAYMEWSVDISFDNQRLYFASDRPGGYGDFDLWVSEWNSSQWGAATNLGPNVNTLAPDESPSISSDGNTLYFARWMFVSEMLDIYASEWQDTTWGPAVNLGPPVNTPTWDDGPSISTDGTKLYFASSRDTNDPAVQDIWVSEWIPEGVEDEDKKWKIENTRLLKIEPNPFILTTVIRLSLAGSADVSLKIYDISGRMVRSLMQGRKDTGRYEVLWDGRNEEREQVNSGIYFCRLTTRHLSQTAKIVLIR